MNILNAVTLTAISAALLLMTACSNDENRPRSAQPETTATETLTVYKSPTCGCCSKWQDHLTASGLSNQGQNTELMSQLKNELGIRPQYRSCHTGVSKNGYVFEGHVPAKYIKQFLDNPPDNAIGLSVPAMPIGSPGMEVDNGKGGTKFMAYRVLLLKNDGSTEVYASVTDYEQQF